MIRVSLFGATLVLMACAGHKPEPPTPAMLAADSVRARVIAEMIDEPRNDSISPSPRSPTPNGPGGSGGVIVAFVVDDGMFIVPSTITILQLVGTPDYAKAVCQRLPRFTFQASPAYRRRSLVTMAFFYFPLGEFDKSVPSNSEPMRQRLEDMPRTEREAWLRGKGCDQYR